MVSNDNEDSVLKPYFLFCIINELTNRIIRIFNSGFPRVRITIHFYFPSRVGVGAMIAGSHNLCKERMSRLVICIEHLQAFSEYIFITDTPYICESHLVVRDIFPINYLITVMTEEVAHIVKIAVSTVDELRFVA